MRKFSFLFLFLFFTVTSCDQKNKADTVSDSRSKSVGFRTDPIQNDTDWIKIVDQSYEFMNRLQSSNYDVRTYTDSTKNDFYAALNLTKVQFDSMVNIATAAANRLKIRYSISNASDCYPCSDSLGGSLAKLYNYQQYFKNHTNALDTFVTDLGGTPRCYDCSTGGSTGNPGGEPTTCGFKYYACCAVCVPLAEALPLALACVYLCYCSWCTPPHPICND